MSGNKWYWRLQIAGWTLHGTIGMLFTYYFRELTLKGALLQYTIAAVLLLTTHFFRYWIKKKGWLKLRVSELTLRVVPTLIVLSFLSNGVLTVIGFYIVDFVPEEEFSWAIYLMYSFQTFLYFGLWTGFYLVIYFFRNYKKEEVEKWRLQSAVKDAELIALKAQINPHFLFNALNNIRALILEDHMKARDMVSHLSELLRYSIQFNNSEKVTVGEELQIVTKYLELETIHYENRLRFEIAAEKELLEFKIPPMIIQLMAENAVKHGISKVRDGGVIKICVKMEEGNLSLQVSNTGKLGKVNGSGIGLKNAMERIRILFEKEPDLELMQNGNSVQSTLKLPVEQ